MLNTVIIALVLLGLSIHRYLSTLLEQGRLPYQMGFLFFANLFAVLYLVSFVWMFGLLAGIVVTMLCYFQIVYSAGLWLLSLPWLLSMHRNRTMPRVNPLAYGGFSFLVMALGLLATANFFLSRYKSGWKLFGETYMITALVFLAILIVGNLSRVVIMSKLMKE